MNALQIAGCVITAAVLVLLFFRVFMAPLRLILKLAANTLLGFAALIAANILGFTIGVNLFNAIVVAVLGLPGAGLLILLRWLMVT